ncbi:ABC transporter permease [Bacillus sp. V3B]|uniref:ABC transporter permease n=1 Tax=Bacillus sp. V3B TaxID=2804915 RepID=UPI00210A1EAD|nr:ABC transporter permease [Bacillus sp. V3B]MCQ6274825.1 ABC transporter permease [Bacillus sp. V3B]
MRIAALVKRIFQQMLRDKRALALMMVAPLIILTLFHYLFSSDTANPTMGVVNADESFVTQLEKRNLDVIQYDQLPNNEKIMDNELDAVLEMNGSNINLVLTNIEPSVSKAIQMKVQQTIVAENTQQQAKNLSLFIQTVQGKLQGTPIELETVEPTEIHTSYVYGSEDASFFDLLSPILVGFFVFFFVFLISGIALLRERTTGTLERLMSTPIQRRDIVFGYLIGYGIFAVIQSLIVVFYAVKVLDIVVVGSLWNVILINLTLALVALSLGILLSAFANSEFQMMQFIPIVIIPQIFFAGILPVEGMANWLQVVAHFMPMYYGGNALVDVMYKGLGFTDILNDVLVLLGFALLFLILNVLALKKYRKM